MNEKINFSTTKKYCFKNNGENNRLWDEVSLCVIRPGMGGGQVVGDEGGTRGRDGGGGTGDGGRGGGAGCLK